MSVYMLCAPYSRIRQSGKQIASLILMLPQRITKRVSLAVGRITPELTDVGLSKISSIFFWHNGAFLRCRWQFLTWKAVHVEVGIIGVKKA